MREYRTETRRYKVGCGELRINIAFKGDESFHFALICLDNQDNQCGCCWLEVEANNLTMLLRRIEPKDYPALIKNHKNQRCSKGLESCPNAISKALEEILNEITAEVTKP